MHRHSPCFYCSTTLTTQPTPAIQHAHLGPLLEIMEAQLRHDTDHWKPCLHLADSALTQMAPTNCESKSHVRQERRIFGLFDTAGYFLADNDWSHWILCQSCSHPLCRCIFHKIFVKKDFACYTTLLLCKYFFSVLFSITTQAFSY